MRQLLDLSTIKVPAYCPLDTRRKEIAFNDENSPHPGNHVELTGTGSQSIAIRYRVNDSHRRRAATKRHVLRGALKKSSYGLYAVDAAFFPISSGTDPSSTIAASAP